MAIYRVVLEGTMEMVISEPRSKVVRKCTLGMSPERCSGQREQMERPRGWTLPGWLRNLRKATVAGEERSGKTGDGGRDKCGWTLLLKEIGRHWALE